MPHVPGTFKQNRWVLAENPNYAGKKPRPLQAVCHDGTPFITIRCSCGNEMHQHESRVKHIPVDSEVASPCPACQELLVFPPGFFARAFQELRDQGWVDE